LQIARGTLRALADAWISSAYGAEMDLVEWLILVMAGWGGVIALALVLLWSRN